MAEAGYIAFGDARPDRVVIDGGPDTAKRLADGQAAAARRDRPDRARRVPAASRRGPALRDVRLRDRLPEGLRGCRLNSRLPFDDPPSPLEAMIARDETARAHAVDPARNVVLEASAGTGKTHVLVTRYINLIRAGVDPANILAITFTRKAAAEMRERIVLGLRDLAAAVARRRGALARAARPARRHRDQHHRRLLLRAAARVPARGGPRPRLRRRRRDGDAAPGRGGARRRAARRRAGSRPPTPTSRCCSRRSASGRCAPGSAACSTAACRPARRFAGSSARPAGRPRREALRPPRLDAAGRRCRRSTGGVEAFIADGPVARRGLPAAGGRPARRRRGARAAAGARDASGDGDRRGVPGARGPRSRLPALPEAGRRRAVEARVRQEGRAVRRPRGRATRGRWPPRPRASRTRSRRSSATSTSRWSAPRGGCSASPAGATAARSRRSRRSISRRACRARSGCSGRWTSSRRAATGSRRATTTCSWTSSRTPTRRSGGWSRGSIESWGEGIGLAHDGPLQPSIFIVGDRKQSIYGFRDADVRMIRRAGRYISALRPAGKVRRSISRSFRAAPELLAFTNDLFASIDTSAPRADAFRYTARDRFPVESAPARFRRGWASWPRRPRRRPPRRSPPRSRACSRRAPSAIARRGCRAPRARATSRSSSAPRESHREIEAALEARGIPDLRLQGPRLLRRRRGEGPGRAAALPGEPGVAAAGRRLPAIPHRAAVGSGRARRSRRPSRRSSRGASRCRQGLDEEDRRVLDRLRASLGRWLPLVDRVPPAEVLDRVIDDAAYAFELRGARAAQARENLKKIRADDAPAPEPRLRDDVAHRGAPRSAVGRRRVERGGRRARRGQPDDGARGQGARVPDRVRHAPHPRDRRPRRPDRPRAGRPGRNGRWCRSAGTCRRRAPRSRSGTARRRSGCSTSRSRARASDSTCRRC